MTARQSHFVITAHGGRCPAFSGPTLYRFAHRDGAQYPVRVADTEATGFGSPIVPRRTTAAVRFFYVRVPSRASTINGWATVGRLRPAGSLGRRSSNPAVCPPTPFGSGERVQPVQGGRAMRQSTHAHTGQQSHVIQSIVRAALRDAATASTYQDALDATGAALTAIAALVRAEVRHG